MPVYTYSPEKNSKLVEERNIGFEEIISAIESEQLLDVMEHPNHEKYGGQKIYVVLAKEYVYLVPYVMDEEGNIFLKTIIPSRKAKSQYLKEGKNEKKKKSR